MTNDNTLRLIQERVHDLGSWLDEAAPYVQFDQMHLDHGTPEQAYWHLGYRAALVDILALIANDAEGRLGTANRSPSGGPGE